MFFRKYKIVFCILIVFFMLSFIADLFSPGKYTSTGVVKRIQNDLKRKTEDFNLFTEGPNLNSFFSDSLNEKSTKNFIKKDYAIFFYKNNEILPCIWNTQEVVPSSVIVTSNKQNYLAHLSNGWYLVRNKSLNINKEIYKIIALIPVKRDYYITNTYLKNTFNAVDGVDDRFIISEKPTKLVIKDFEGNILFYLGTKNLNSSSYNNILSIFLKLLAVILCFYLLHQYARQLVEDKGILLATAFLIIIVLIIRVISYFLPFPINFDQFDLFNTAIYHAGPILNSLGDLFINTSIMVWIVFFIKDHILKLEIKFPENVTRKVPYTFLVALLMIGCTILFGYTVNTLVTDSQLSFDVLNFFSLNIYSVLGFVILCSISTLYFFVMKVLLHLMKPAFQINIYLSFSVISVCALIVVACMIGKSYFIFYFSLLLWMIGFLILLNYKNLSTFKPRIISSKIIFWIFFFSLSITIVLVTENRKKELDNRKHYLENIADKTDPSGERMMSITLADLKNDYLPTIFPRFNNKQENYLLKDSLLHNNFPGFLNRYETKMYTFDSLGTPLFNTDSTSLNALNVIFETQSRPTSTPDLSYYDVSFERFNYITRKVVKLSAQQVAGYLFIISSPKKYKADELSPQLFNKGNAEAIENSPVYSYAVYFNRYLINSYNDYPFPTKLPKDLNFYTNFYLRNINGNSELWYKVNSNKLVVITKPDNALIEALTLFAYLFCAFLAGITLVNIILILIGNGFSWRLMSQNINLTIRNQVHGTIIFISLVSFIIIGITTILFFINRYNKNDHEKLSRTINLIENDINNESDSAFNFINKTTSVVNWRSNPKFEAALYRIADIHGTYINIYDLRGNLQWSSLPLPYTKGLLSNSMDPLAYFHLAKIRDAQFFSVQHIGDLDYLNNYIPLKNKSGVEYGYLNIPYFESQNKLYDEISNFLITIINLNAFIFLIGGIIAFFITNRITDSFSFISQKMRAINIGKTNEQIQWHRNDEISELVKEYNRMVNKLDESAQELARTEREGAWREMARQVAHEIKNPLTPMKLNLQYLQMAIDNKSGNVADVSMYVSKILLEQIDHLSQIASDFAQFADINHSHNQKFDLNEVLKKIYLLYAGNNTFNIKFNQSAEAIYIFADKTQIQRVFTNLMQNAVQSIPDNKIAEVEIGCSVKDNKILTTVKDNGNGIPLKTQHKIFIPNFTTKSSGTGLGLAMSKGIVEKSGGRIWFTTEENVGTTFYVELPLESE